MTLTADGKLELQNPPEPSRHRPGFQPKVNKGVLKRAERAEKRLLAGKSRAASSPGGSDAPVGGSSPAARKKRSTRAPKPTTAE